MYPYSTQNRKIWPIPPGLDGKAKPVDSSAGWFPKYLVPLCAGAIVGLYFEFTAGGRPTGADLNFALAFGSAMALIGLVIGLSKGLLKRTFGRWKLASVVAVVYVLWLLAGLVGLASNILSP